MTLKFLARNAVPTMPFRPSPEVPLVWWPFVVLGFVSPCESETAMAGQIQVKDLEYNFDMAETLDELKRFFLSSIGGRKIRCLFSKESARGIVFMHTSPSFKTIDHLWLRWPLRIAIQFNLGRHFSSDPQP